MQCTKQIAVYLAKKYLQKKEKAVNQLSSNMCDKLFVTNAS